jgi:CheY-like chemotaxis protein
MSTTALPELSKSSSTQSMSVCILDHDRDMVRVLQKTVEQFGFVTFGTCDPRDALEQIASGRCRVILCDLETP